MVINEERAHVGRAPWERTPAQGAARRHLCLRKQRMRCELPRVQLSAAPACCATCLCVKMILSWQASGADWSAWPPHAAHAQFVVAVLAHVVNDSGQ